MKPKLIKLIAILLVQALLWQRVGWAYSDGLHSLRAMAFRERMAIPDGGPTITSAEIGKKELREIADSLKAAVGITIVRIREARKKGIISKPQARHLISLARALNKKQNVFIYSPPADRILTTNDFFQPIQAGKRVGLVKDLVAQRWFKTWYPARRDVFLADILLYRLLNNDEALTIQIIGEDRFSAMKGKVNTYLENYPKPSKDRNLALLEFDEELEAARGRITEAFGEVIDLCFARGSAEYAQIVDSLTTLKVLYGPNHGRPERTSYNARVQSMYLQRDDDKPAAAHEFGHHIANIFDIDDPFNVMGNVVAMLYNASYGYETEQQNYQEGEAYGQAFLDGQISEVELKVTIIKKWRFGETLGYDFFTGARHTDDYTAGCFLAGLIDVLTGRNKRRAMQFLINLPKNEWFKTTYELLTQNFDELYFGRWTLSTLLAGGVIGWAAYMCVNFLVASLAVGVLIGISVGAYAVVSNRYDKQLKERIGRFNPSDFGPPIEGIVSVVASSPRQPQPVLIIPSTDRLDAIAQPQDITEALSSI